MKLYLYTNQFDYQLYLANCGIIPNKSFGEKITYGGLSTVSDTHILLFTELLKGSIVTRYCEHNNIKPVIIEFTSVNIVNSKIYIIDKNYNLRLDWIENMTDSDLCICIDYLIPLLYADYIYLYDAKDYTSGFANVPNYEFGKMLRSIKYGQYKIEIDLLYNLVTGINLDYQIWPALNKIRAGYFALYSSFYKNENKLIININKNLYNNIKCKDEISYESLMKNRFGKYLSKINLDTEEDEYLFSNIDQIFINILKKDYSSIYKNFFQEEEKKIGLLTFSSLIEACIFFQSKTKNEFLTFFVETYNKQYNESGINDEKNKLIYDRIFQDFPSLSFDKIMKTISQKEKYRSFKFLYLIYLNIDVTYSNFIINLKNYSLSDSNNSIMCMLYGLLRGFINISKYNKEDSLLVRFIDKKIQFLEKFTDYKIVKYNIMEIDSFCSKYKPKLGYLSKNEYNIIVECKPIDEKILLDFCNNFLNEHSKNRKKPIRKIEIDYEANVFEIITNIHNQSVNKKYKELKSKNKEVIASFEKEGKNE